MLQRSLGNVCTGRQTLPGNFLIHLKFKVNGLNFHYKHVTVEVSYAVSFQELFKVRGSTYLLPFACCPTCGTQRSITSSLHIDNAYYKVLHYVNSVIPELFQLSLMRLRDCDTFAISDIKGLMYCLVTTCVRFKAVLPS